MFVTVSIVLFDKLLADTYYWCSLA